MNVLEFNRRFMRIEEQLGLFPDTRVADPGWWDVVRYDVMQLAYARVVGTEPVAILKPALATRLAHFAARLTMRGLLELRLRILRYEVLVYRCPRLLSEGKRVDVAMDQYLAVCPGRTLVIDTFPYRFDRIFVRASKLARRPDDLEALEKCIRTEFNVELDLDIFVRQRLANFESAVRHYTRFLARVRPKLILLTQNGIEKALFRAAREAGVPCIEVQHGLINDGHAAYAYPSSVTGLGRAMFPDGLLAFSDFWLKSCHYPVTWSVATGNDAFVPPEYGIPEQTGDVLVITAIKYNDRMCEWTERIAANMPQRKFKFKLHPSQGSHKSAIVTRLRHLPNVEVIGTDRTTSELMRAASDVLLIQSTVAYEAVQAGRRLTVIAEYDSGLHADLFGFPNVNVVHDLEGLQASLSAPLISTAKPTFFMPFDAALARNILAQTASTSSRDMDKTFPKLMGCDS